MLSALYSLPLWFFSRLGGGCEFVSKMPRTVPILSHFSMVFFCAHIYVVAYTNVSYDLHHTLEYYIYIYITVIYSIQTARTTFLPITLQMNFMLRYRYILYRTTDQHRTGTDNYLYINEQWFCEYWFFLPETYLFHLSESCRF